MRQATAILCQVVGGGSTDGGGLNRKNGPGPAQRSDRRVPPWGAAFDHAIGSGGVRDALTTGYLLRFLRNGGCAPTRAAPTGIDRRWQRRPTRRGASQQRRSQRMKRSRRDRKCLQPAINALRRSHTSDSRSRGTIAARGDRLRRRDFRTGSDRGGSGGRLSEASS
ncbi:hypothetical protein Poly24_22250 [Rosistilla carotiformis]|uniref:Uncharacterized protein n=1 Tax=Rosistilla carotiformis TaxID=2528017 RepID=A0A518JSJ5_9BACT|nr:hypothetical protein Poly24_22250 [Rosistilla carotiformis]